MFEEEVRSKSQHLLSDTQMDTMMKDNFALWLQNKVFYYSSNKFLIFLLISVSESIWREIFISGSWQQRTITIFVKRSSFICDFL